MKAWLFPVIVDLESQIAQGASHAILQALASISKGVKDSELHWQTQVPNLECIGAQVPNS